MKLYVQKLFINTTLPSLNNIINAAGYAARSKHSYATLKRSWTSVCGHYITQAKLKPVANTCHIDFLWCEKNKRRDKDNVAAGGRKIILDALVKFGVLGNDGWKNVESWSDTFEVKKSSDEIGVLLTIYERDGHENKAEAENETEESEGS